MTLAIAAIALNLSSPSDEWARRPVPDTRVSVELPGELAAQPKEEEAKANGDKEYEYAGVGYTVTASVSQPNSKVRVTNPILDVARDEVLRALRSDDSIETKVLERSDAAIDGAPTRRVCLSMLIEKMDFRTRFTIIGDATRLVVLTIIRNPEDEDAEKDAARIDRSIRVGVPADR